MPPKRKNGNPKARLHDLAADPSKLSLQERKFVVALDAFNHELQAYRSLFADLKTFSPLLDSMDEIENGLEEGMFWTLDYVDGKIEYRDLVSNLREDTAETLQNNLDLSPSLFRKFPDGASKLIEKDREDIETMCERLWEQLRVKGYDLYHVLIGAA